MQPAYVPWEDRAKSVTPLVDGYSAFLDSLRWIANSTQEAPIRRMDLVDRIVERFNITKKSAITKVSFLGKVDFLRIDSGICTLPDLMQSWLREGDPTPLMVQLHRRVRFIGEMLKALDEPLATARVRQRALEQYEIDWKTNAQIDRRRGWLQSAGLMGRRGDGHLYRTDAGTAFLDFVVVEPPFDRGPVSAASLGGETAQLDRASGQTTERRPSRAAHIPWENRASGVQPMTGGNDRFLESLRRVAENLQEIPPKKTEIISRVAGRLSVSEKSAAAKISFLQKIKFLRFDSGMWILTDLMKSWVLDGDPIPLMVQLHRRIQFIGEMLEALNRPMKVEDLRLWACEQYLMNWQTNTQIDNRRGWLQSAGLMARHLDGRLYRTDQGTGFLELVVVEAPFKTPPSTPPSGIAQPAASGTEASQQDEAPTAQGQIQSSGPVAEFVDRLLSASTDTANPTEVEVMVRDAFGSLGFDAEHLGGSGKTDVLVDARLGSGISYRVAIDAKTTASASLPDHQVDWLTLRDHRRKHDADYSMIVGPNPSARRLLERAQDEGVAVLSVEALAGLCRSHAAQPLGLADYKSMFERGGNANLSHIEERWTGAGRRAALARRLLDAIREDAMQFGPVIARDLHRVLGRDEGTIVATESEIQGLLDTLASPLVGAIHGDSANGYVLACSPAVTAARLRILGDVLASQSEAEA